MRPVIAAFGSHLPHHATMTLMRSIFVRSLAFALAVVTAAPVAGAQGTTSGAIRGRVTGDAGQPLDAATVVAVNQATNLTLGAQTDETGVYVIRLLQPGIYTVTARRIGQEPSTVRDVRVTVGTTTPVNFTLRTAAVALTGVQITAERPQIDVTDAGVSTNVSQEQIDNLPTLGRDFTDFINLSGLVSPTPEATTGGQFSIAGQRPSQTNLQIDGVDANNAFFGENRGGSRTPFAFSLESIREFQVITNGYDVEYGNYSGGIVNIVTRGGTNRLKGSVYGNYRGDQFTRNDFSGVPAGDFNAQQYAALVEGPIVRDKAFFLFSLDGQRRREPFRPFSVAGFRAEGDSAEADSLERIIEILETKYGVPNAAANYSTFQIHDDVLTLFGRLDWTVNQNHRLSLRNNYSKHDNLNEAGSFGTDAGLSQAETFNSRTNSLVGEVTSVLSSRAFNVFRIQYSMEERPRQGNDVRPTIRVPTGEGRTVEYGGTTIAFRNSLDENKLQLVNNFTYDLGQHTLKVGTNNTFSRFDNVFWFGGSGLYEFASIAKLDSLQPSSFTRSIRGDRQLPRAKFSAQDYSVYAQDDFQVTPRLLMQLGLRYDVQRYSNRPGRVVDVERAFGIETGLAPIDDDNVSPRVAITFDRRGDASEVWRAGAGLFYGRVPYVLGSNVAITDNPLLTLTCDGRRGDPNAPPEVDYANWTPNGDDNPAACEGSSTVSGTPSYTFWRDDFEMPETFKANVGYERQFTPRWRAGLDLLMTDSRRLYTVRDLNLRDAVFTLDGEGGRQVFVPGGSFSPSGSAGTARRRNTDFAQIYMNFNEGVARSMAASVKADHRLTDSISLNGSYTYTWAYDNASYSCCTANEGYRNVRNGAFGPNMVGGSGEEDKTWGPSDYVRNHTIVLSSIARLPWGVQLSTIFRLQSGRPWGPEVQGDINGDGESFNDRPFIFRPEDLPVYTASSDTNPLETVARTRERYASYLSQLECVGDYVGQIIPRNSCRQPWFNSLDMSIRKKFRTAGTQEVELSLDLFNVLNGLNKDWGRNLEIAASSRNLLVPQGYDAVTNRILYTVPGTFSSTRPYGASVGLVQQFSAQIGARYRF